MGTQRGLSTAPARLSAATRPCVGGLANSLMGLILPPLFLLARCRAALLVSMLGVALLISSTYFTIQDML